MLVKLWSPPPPPARALVAPTIAIATSRAAPTRLMEDGGEGHISLATRETPHRRSYFIRGSRDLDRHSAPVRDDVMMAERRRGRGPTGRAVLLWVHSPPVQLSVSSPFPSHALPLYLGAGELHSRLLCLSHWLLHTVHSLHSSQPPSTATRQEVRRHTHTHMHGHRGH